MENELKIGQEVWIEYKKGILEKIENGIYEVKVESKDSITTYYSKLVPQVPKFQLNTFWKNKVGKIFHLTDYTCWAKKDDITLKIELVMYYKFIYYNDTFSGYNYECEKGMLKEGYELLNENPFQSEDEIIEQIGEIDSEIHLIEKEIQLLEEKIKEVEKRKIPIRERCMHKWEHNEVKTGKKTWMGEENKKESVCEICGLEKIIYTYSL